MAVRALSADAEGLGTLLLLKYLPSVLRERWYLGGTVPKCVRGRLKREEPRTGMVLFPMTSLWTLQCELVITFYKSERRQKREARFLNRVSRLSLFLAEASYNGFLLRPMHWAHGLSGAFSHSHQALKKEKIRFRRLNLRSLPSLLIKTFAKQQHPLLTPLIVLGGSRIAFIL